MIVLKLIKNTILILLILVIISIPVFMYLVKFGNNSFVGERLKSIVLQEPKLVRLLNLNEPGDSRYLYFDSETEKLSVKVITVNSKNSNDEVDLWIKEMVSETVGKDSAIGIHENIGYPKTKLLTDEDLNQIRKNVISHGDGDLYLIYASSYAEKESSVGLVLHRDTIFIFRDAIEALSERESTKDVLEQTTIMHEWGHLLGMGHVNDGACIMDELVDVYDYPPIGKNLPTKYCQTELRELKKLY